MFSGDFHPGDIGLGFEVSVVEETQPAHTEHKKKNNSDTGNVLKLRVQLSRC